MKKGPALTIMAILAIIAILAISRCTKYKNQALDTDLMLDLTEKKFTAFKTESGLNAGRADSKIMDLQTLLALEKDKVNKLTRELNLKPRAITKIVEVQLEGKDSVILKRDTLLYAETYETPAPFTFKDKWNYFEAFVDGDEIGLVYAIQDSIQLVETAENGRRTFTAMTSNPAVRITGLSSITIDAPKKKKKQWWIIPVAIAAGTIAGAKLF